MTTRLPTRLPIRLLVRRRLRTLLLILGAAVLVAVGTGCKPPPRGVEIAKNHAWKQLKQRGWIPQAGCLVALWQAESGWNVYALNKASGAYGIPQALPAGRMASAGRNWVHDPAVQVRWGLNYIQHRYGGPCNAWRHFQRTHWYVLPETANPANATTG